MEVHRCKEILDFFDFPERSYGMLRSWVGFSHNFDMLYYWTSVEMVV